MTLPPAEQLAPHIRIELSPGEVEILQARPAITSCLTGRPVSSALSLVPTLLPVCGQAQSVAAQRAVAAALGSNGQQQGTEAESQLWREQAFAAAWRNCVDWPGLLGEPRDMEALGRVHRAASDASCSAALADLIPGLDSVASLDQLFDWLHDSPCIGARVARLAVNTGPPLPGIRCVADDELLGIATTALQRDPFQPLDPWELPLEVGALAMQRDPLVSLLQDALGAGILARLLAQLLDTRVICRGLRGGGAGGTPDTHSWSTRAGTGMGRAITCRGPVFHRVVLGPQQSVADWRVLAPTDWHFGPRGPVARALGSMVDTQAAKLLVTSYDPCAPWSLHTAIGEV